MVGLAAGNGHPARLPKPPWSATLWLVLSSLVQQDSVAYANRTPFCFAPSGWRITGFRDYLSFTDDQIIATSQDASRLIKSPQLCASKGLLVLQQRKVSMLGKLAVPGELSALNRRFKLLAKLRSTFEMCENERYVGGRDPADAARLGECYRADSREFFTGFCS